MDTLSWLQTQLGVKPLAQEHVQTLWSGYGEITRVRCDDGHTVIVKKVDPPDDASHPRGWNGAKGHARKLRSYTVESAFYLQFAPDCMESARVPRLLAQRQRDNRIELVLEDLDAAGFERRLSRAGRSTLLHCIRWLASFHACFLNRAPTGLWRTGTYWHLETRPDELEVMAAGPLRDAAQELDARLGAARFQTLVHGDAKIANFCFGRDGVAAVDFQYVGGGCGIKDLAYFLGSCLSERELQAKADAAVDAYFEALRAALNADVNADALENEWRALYPIAWADFERFLAGWAPSHGKRHGYSKRMTERALQTLR